MIIKKLTYITTNRDKFIKAQQNLLPFKIELIQKNIELTEIQSFSGEEVVAAKLKQAFETVKTPVLVGDDSWSIPALGGFPATNMKQCNHFLQAKDWLRLMDGIQDRRIFLISYLGYFDGQKTSFFSMSEECYFLNQIQGSHPSAPHLSVVAFHGEKQSIAEYLAQGMRPKENQKDFWIKVAEEIKSLR